MKPQYFDNVYKIQCLRGLDCRSDDGPCKKLFGNSYLPIAPPPPGDILIMEIYPANYKLFKQWSINYLTPIFDCF